ncbi:UvrABC system protein C [Bacterioplanes sanyensis]|uniref:excinuclease ABC subunit UvrC n=1 Tax=Bacterioplanes sanyensis TaxID=1249553 RepID=UPI001675001B|nr:excinuclease ABC subunit UvrC [Bacterioplanes sanyensis]GGY41398.1 UvrABC system protein C [Bacterioplanes sanyensis]
MSEFDIPAFLSNLTRRAGVYRMYDADDELLYVGKAKHLKNRVSSYFRARGLNAKTVALVSRIARIEVTVTGSEAEALLLEQTLIKRHRPPYNILLKDDRSYPYLHLSQHDYPMLSYRRGKRRGSGRFFGPYPNSGAVREALNHMQKLFLLRSCEDSYFNHRSRPCLQYEIRRCSGPCVGHISASDYQRDVEHAVLFLQGKNRELTAELQQDMQQAAEGLQFERAAELRDQIDLLRRIQEKQNVDADKGDADAWALVHWQGVGCLHRLSFRRGRLVNSQNFFPDNPAGLDDDELLAEYLSQFYLGGHAPEGIPRDIIADIDTDAMAVVLEALQLESQKRARHVRGVRGQPRQWLHMAQENARTGAQNHISAAQAARHKLTQVQTLLRLSKTPQRIECFDISHAQGEATFASCVVYDHEGLNKSRYRRFGIKGVAAGDDYAALEQAVRRHLTRLSEQQDCPDLLLIDGGQGQIGRIQAVLDEMQLNEVQAFGISKGETRKSGWEFLWQAGNRQPIIPDAHDEGFRLLQWVRDEAHRFAITGHRKARAKSRGRSGIEALPGVGPKRRKALLLHFGSLKNMSGAAREEIARVPGISSKLAEQIFAHLHGEPQE